MKKAFTAIFFLLLFFYCSAQVDTANVQDTSDVAAVRRTVNLSEVVVRSDLNINRFLQQIKNDTSFYKAFRNLRVLSFTSLNDIRMLDKSGAVAASLQSKTRQNRDSGCRTMNVLEEKTTGDLYDRNHDWNYYTAQLYASLFFTRGKVCGENNIIKTTERNVQDKQGLEKHKEQLKMLFFNPGKRVPGIPFIGDKLDIFDEDVARYYDFSINVDDAPGQPCYLFTIKTKPHLTGGERDKIVFDNITTWFDAKTLNIVARNYDLSYDTGLYDFKVHIEVKMAQFGDLLVPQVLRYNGNWHVAFKKREHGVFTATLFDFKP